MSHQLFESQEHTSKYRQHRPGYPSEVFEHVRNYYFNGHANEKKIPLAVDIGCGNGQATNALSNFCERVIGIDSSANQIAQATKKANIEYRCHRAEDLSFLPADSVDLITAATALHWLEIEAFLGEVKRVLKPNTGVLAIWTYGIGALDNPRADAIYHEFNQITLFSYWNSKRWLVDDYYQSLLPLFPFQATLAEHTVAQRISTTIEQFLGFIETLSACQTFREQEGERAYRDLLANFRDKLLQAYQTGPARELSAIPVTVSNAIRLYLMRKQ